MKRGSHGDFFLKLLERIRATIPGVAIRTSMIVGFPGETEADFEILCDFVKAAQFDRLGVFSYSDEDTSASFQLDAKVDARTIYNRKRKSDGHAAAHLESAEPQNDRPGSGRADRRPVRGNRSAVAGAHVHASARDRRRLLSSTILARCAAAAWRDPPHANHRSARLRPDRRADRFARPNRRRSRSRSRSRSSPHRDEVPDLQKGSPPGDEFFPFCSERCKIIDLGNWASENTSSRRRSSPRNQNTTAWTMSLSPLPTAQGRRGSAHRHLVRLRLCARGPGTAGSLAALLIAIALHLAYGSGRGTFLLLAGDSSASRHLGGRRGREADRRRKIRTSSWSTK